MGGSHTALLPSCDSAGFNQRKSFLQGFYEKQITVSAKIRADANNNRAKNAGSARRPRLPLKREKMIIVHIVIVIVIDIVIAREDQDLP